MKIIKCKKISRGHAKGPVLITKEPISFLGGVDPYTGIIIDKEHELYGKKISNKILVIPSGKGSTVGSYVLFQMSKSKTAPMAIISVKAEPIIATGAIMAGIPMVHQPEDDLWNLLDNDDVIEVDADSEIIKVFKN